MKLTENEESNYRFLIANDITHMSAEQIAEILFVSRAAIYRVCHKMGYRSFTHLKYVKEQKVEQKIELQEVDNTDVFNYVDDTQLLLIIEKILQAQHVYIIGTHATSIAAQYLCRQLINLGCLAVRINDEFELDHLRHKFTAKDVVFCLSASGENTVISNYISPLDSTSVAITKQNSSVHAHCQYAITFDFSIYKDKNSFDRENIFPLIVIIQKLLINMKKILDEGV